MRISNYPTDTLDGTELILATNQDTTTQKYKTVNFTIDTLKTYIHTDINDGVEKIIFEGATADAYETTLGVVDPTADITINLPNVAGTLPVLAVASTTAITSTPEELNVLDGYTGSVTELNYLDTLHATGVTDTEFDYLDITTLGLVEASKVATASSNGDIKFPDNKKIQLGADGDFEISHTGTDTLFKNVKENGTTIFQVNDGGTTRSAIQAGGAGGYVKLYGNGVKRLETTTDGVTIGWPLQLNDTLTVGVDDTGYDVKFFGATAGKYLLWDASEDQLIINGDVGTRIVNGGDNTNPSIYWGTDTNTGIYHDSDNAVKTTINGTKRVEVGAGYLQVYGDVIATEDVKAAQFKLSALNTAPSSASDTGTLGEVRIDASYIYVCTASNTWKRAQIATW